MPFRRRRPPGPRRAARAAALAAALALLLAAGWPAAAGGAEAAAPARPVVRAPHYGDALFSFYQAQYFTSVTGLMTSQHFARMVPHADEAELLRGGLFLSYGLHREAGEVFERLLERGAPAPVRDRAWYYLARIRYQRGQLAGAADALARIGGPLPPEQQEERLLLGARLMMARGDHAGAARLLAEAGERASAYARFNLGVALIRAGQPVAGGAALDRIGQAPAPTEELKGLRDKANLALGYSALQDGHPEHALAFLARVRLDGLHANRALLAYGWAALARRQPERALAPWTELAARDESDGAVLESRLALPYAMAEAGSLGLALGRYQEALASFEREDARLDESIAAIRAGRLLDGLIALNPGAEMGWFWSIERLPTMPHAAHLNQVLAQHEFQEGFKNWRDLHFLIGNLQQWQDTLAVFDDMLDTRRRAFAERLPAVAAGQRAAELQAREARRDALVAELAQVEAQADVAAFADPRERGLAERIARVEATLAALGDEPRAAAARERLRRAAGALRWEQTRAWPARAWEARKALGALDAGLADARRREAALMRALAEEPARFDAFAARIEALRVRVAALAPRLAQLEAEQRGAVQELAVAELERQRERLEVYATHARLAVAQIFDRARLAREGGDAGGR